MILPPRVVTALKVALGLLPPAVLVVLRKRILRSNSEAVLEVPFSRFLQDAKEGNLASVVMDADRFEVALLEKAKLRLARYVTRIVPLLDRKGLLELLTNHGVTFGARQQHWLSLSNVMTVLLGCLPIVYVIAMIKIVSQMNNPKLENDEVGKAHKANLSRSVTFADVEGIDSAKEELAEIVNFLRDSGPYEAMGARLPKGVLLSGPSGTGKTLLARAVASESGVPFISCSASDFVAIFVGRGAQRVRDLFQRGAAAAPCIIFIDELDALAKVRGGLNSNDEREQTLNQLLTEMDGFDTGGMEGGDSDVLKKVVVIAATNRTEVLDPALVRPGRFDRHVVVGLPDLKGRVSILRVHCRKVKLSGDVILQDIARVTEGFSGAELANVVNEAALLAVRGGSGSVSMNFMKLAIRRAHSYRAMYCKDQPGVASELLVD